MMFKDDTVYYPPQLGKANFHCSSCGVYSEQAWSPLSATGSVYSGRVRELGLELVFEESIVDDYVLSRCRHCRATSIWHGERLLYPRQLPVEPPHPDLSKKVQQLYLEAANVFPYSTRSAAALMRLALQIFLKDIGESGTNINTDIGSLVSKGVEKSTQKALDAIRIFGNNSVHPGQINPDEDSMFVQQMFALINFVATKLIAQEKEIESIYSNLPVPKKEQIEKRDQGKSD